MSHLPRKHPSSSDPVAALDDEGSAIRPAAGVRPRQDSAPVLRAAAAAPRRTRPAAGSLDDRLERKVRLATALARELPPTDTRVRLLNIAIMRRDESLLDGVLAELSHPTGGG